MRTDSNDKINEGKLIGSEYEDIDRYSSKVSKSICKIITPNQYGSGFFLKYLIDDINYFYLISNEHIITEKMIKNKNEINVYYDNEFENTEIVLNVNERYIKSFVNIEIDATVVEILPKDNVNEIFFLTADLDYSDKTKTKLKGKQIYIPQYPLGGNLKIARGIIKEIYNYEFIHLASTDNASSGSPIFLKESIKVIGIHKQGNRKKTENYGDFIFPIFNILEKDIKNKNQSIFNLNINKELKEDYKKSYGTKINIKELEKKNDQLMNRGMNEAKIILKDMNEINKNKIINEKNFCNNCGMFPLIGKSYKCKTCEDFNFCETCYNKNIKLHGHEFKKIEVPNEHSKIPFMDEILFQTQIKSEFNYLKGMFFCKTTKDEFEIDILKFYNKLVNSVSTTFNLVYPFNLLLCYDNITENQIFNFCERAINYDTHNLFILVRPEEFKINKKTFY